MSKSSTMQDLIGSDLAQGRALMARYHSSSSLSVTERRKRMPKFCQFRRDRALRKLMRIQHERIMKIFSSQPGATSPDANRPG